MSDPLYTFNAGENAVFSFTIKDEEGVAVDLDTVSEATFHLVSDKPYKVVKTWTYRNPDSFSEGIQATGDTGVIEFELLSEESRTPATHTLISEVAYIDTDYFVSDEERSVITTADFLCLQQVTEYGLALPSADVIGDNSDDLLITQGGTILVTGGGEIISA